MSECFSDEKSQQPVDSELQQLWFQGEKLLGEEHFSRFITLHQRFSDDIVWVNNSDGFRTPKNHYSLRLALQELPRYIVAAHAVTPDADAHDFLFKMLEHQEYTFEPNRASDDIRWLTIYFERVAENGRSLYEQDLESIEEIIVGTKETNKMLTSGLWLLGVGERCGLTAHDSAQIITAVRSHDETYKDYLIRATTLALDSLSFTHPDPVLVHRVFEELLKKSEWTNTELYQQFQDVVTFCYPDSGLSINEFLESLLPKTEDENIGTILDRFGDSSQQKFPQESKVQLIQPGNDHYFEKKRGALEHAALPYQIHRTLPDALADLHHLAKSVGYPGEKMAEGLWILDPKGETWFSLGGETTLPHGSIRHTFLPYDVSELSAAPAVFHIHPYGLEDHIAVANPDYPSRELKEYVTKYAMGVPSRADYESVAGLLGKAIQPVPLRSFIAHSLGITEYTFPQSAQDIQTVIYGILLVRDEVLRSFPWEKIDSLYPKPPFAAVLSLLTQKLSSVLPPGFSIQFHPWKPGIAQELHIF